MGGNMAEGFIRGGAGEVNLADILPAQLRAFSTKAQKEAFATQYEEKNPHVIVRREWDTAEEYEERKAGRSVVVRPAQTQGMDPERARKELRRAYANIQGLDPDHPEYDKLWANWTREANDYERMCEMPLTKFTKGVAPRRNDEPIDAKLQEKVNKYASLPERKRRDVLTDTKDAALLRVVRDIEPLPDLQMIAVERMAALGAL
jgi:hypothetical protein